MQLPATPNQTTVMADLSPLTEVLHEYFPAAVAIARPYFANRTLKPDATLLTSMVRYEVKNMLNATGPFVTEDVEKPTSVSSSNDLLTVEMEDVALVGLAGTFVGYNFKILKSADGSLPPPGTSDLRREFYSQQIPLAANDIDLMDIKPNVAILWRPLDDWSRFEIRVAVPKKVKKNRNYSTVETYFCEMVPHPVSTTVRVPTPNLAQDLKDPKITVRKSLSADQASATQST